MSKLDKIVKKPNSMMTSYNLNLAKIGVNEQKVFELLLWFNQKEVNEITWKRLNKELNLDPATKYSHLQKRKLINSLGVLCVSIDNKGKGTGRVLPFFKDVEFSDGNIKWELNERLLELLQNLNDFFYLTNLKQTNKFNNKYSLPMHQLLKSKLSTSVMKEWNYKVEVKELKSLLSLNGKYKDFNDLRKRVLNPAIAEINEFTDIEIINFYKVRGKEEVVFVFKNNVENTTSSN